MQADGSMTTKTLLTVAATVIAAADREIDKTQQIRERLVFWNAPLFQKPVIATEPRLNEAQDASQEENHASSEIAWFSKYLTLRNVLAVVVTATLTTWTIFNFVDTKNEHEVQNWKDKYIASQAELSAEHNRYDFIDKHSGELKTELDGVRSQLTQANSDLSAGKVDVQRLNDQAKTLNGQVKTLTNELTEANKRATTAEANLAAALKK
jgi:septal ring factor EnvC (AmiA/AmiB activator)